MPDVALVYSAALFAQDIFGSNNRHLIVKCTPVCRHSEVSNVT